MTFDVAQVQETQAEPPGFAGVGQPDQQIADFFVLGAQLRAISIAGPNNPEGPQRESAMLAPRRASAFPAVSRR